MGVCGSGPVRAHVGASGIAMEILGMPWGGTDNNAYEAGDKYAHAVGDETSPTPGASTTCTAMYGNGVRIGMAIIHRVR